MDNKILLILFAAALLAACSPKVTTRMGTTADVERQEEVAREDSRRSPCYEALNYAPDTNHLDHTPMKYIRVNFHFMNSKSGEHNLREKDARAWALELLKAGNYALNKNVPSKLPEGNSIPVLPLRYRYKLTPQPGDPTDDGIYFHYDDECYYYISKGRNSNIYERTPFDRYGIQKDSVLNIFLMPHHPDSVASPTYAPVGTGVALGKFLKIAWDFHPHAQLNPWEIRGTFNHEIGHIFGLVHAWAFNDGCDDTPRHSLEVSSNNIMDYNSQQLAFTPCQIGKVRYRMNSTSASARQLLEPSWCLRKDSAHIVIRDSIHWLGMKDLEGDLTVAEGGFLEISCRVSLPPGGMITIAPGGTLVLNKATLHNACGKTWNGIQIQEEKDRKGRLIFIGEPKIEDLDHPFE